MTILSDNSHKEPSDNLHSGDQPNGREHTSAEQPSSTPAPRAKRKGTKVRLDLLLVEQGLAESREQAQRLIMAGEVLVNEEVRTKAGQQIPHDAVLRVRNQLAYVSRGGFKLAGALDDFQLDVAGLTAIDVGASTGGFTDCLLQRGAAHIFAIDVGYGQLAWKIRSDPRVTVLERTNIRHLHELPNGVKADLAVIDASFISLALVLPPTLHLLQDQGQIIALIKPQFEAGKAQVGKGGVVRNIQTHRQVLEENGQLAAELGLTIGGLTLSPLLGPAGNVEFLAWYQRPSMMEIGVDTPHPPTIDVAATIDQLLQQATALRRGRI